MQQQTTYYDSATDETWTESHEVPDPKPGPVVVATVTVEVDPVALTAAVDRAEKATTVAGLRAAVADMGKALNPAG